MMMLAFSTIIHIGILIPFCHGGAIWKLESKWFPQRFSDCPVPRDKMWGLKLPFGLLHCAALCYQRNNCSFFEYENQNCHGYRSTEARTSVVDMIAIRDGSFRKYQNKVVNDGYRNLTSGNTHLYVKASTSLKTRDEALRVCQREGATLVKLDTRKKVLLLNQAFKIRNVKKDFWIGLSKIYSDNTWYWTDGTRLGYYRNWYFTQPDNVRDEMCTAMAVRRFVSGKWMDMNCQNRKYFVCEKA